VKDLETRLAELEARVAGGSTSQKEG
jgi:uncharacterized coiled-coil protein SlyX